MRKTLVVFFAVMASLPSVAQTLDSALAKFANYQPEKVYLHYDKSTYYAGETIWFKAYLMQGFLPAEETKTLYVDWIADNGTVLSHTVSPIVDGATNGQFEVPLDYSGNYVHVRAYTKWMLNFDTAFLYSKDIPVVSKDANKTKTSVSITPSLQLFPEGGDIVLGVKNKIAFKAVDQFGRPVRITAKLVDNKGNVIQHFASIHDGMGVFYITPEEGLTYGVKWTDEKGIENTTSLPAVKNTGVSMQVGVNGSRRVVSISAGKLLPENFRQLHLIGTLNQQLAFKNEIILTDEQTAVRNIPVQTLPSGILTITVFDANWNAIAERITFVNNHEYSFEPAFEVQHWGLGRRKRNELKISIPDSLLGANLSISVTDADIEKDTTENIISHFLLSSEIKGKVYNPAYYFSNNSDSVAQHLDLVMLTNGWRRFKWEEVTKGVLPQFNYAKDTSYLALSGQLYGVPKTQLSGKESIVLLTKEKDTVTKMIVMPINTDGSFSDPELVLFDTLRVYYSLKSKFLKLAEARFMTERLPAPNYSAFSKNFMYSKNLVDTTGAYHHSILASKSLELLKINRGEIMKTVVITTTKKPSVEILNEKYATGMFQSNNSYQFDLVNDNTSIAYQNVANYLQGKVAGLLVSSGNPPSFNWRGGPPAIYIDEMQTDVEMISNIPISDVAFIKVFRPPFMGGFNGGNGAIAIYTRKGDDRTAAGKGLSSNVVTGYTPIKEFYSPNYDKQDPKNDRLDIRTTLYWNPLLLNTTQTKKPVVVSFYNNDVTKSFRVVIEGVSKEGFLTHYEQILE